MPTSARSASSFSAIGTSSAGSARRFGSSTHRDAEAVPSGLRPMISSRSGIAMALLGWRRFVPALGARASDRVSLLKSWRAGGALIRTYSSINSRTLVVTRHNPQLVPVATLGCAQQINEVTAAHLPIHGAQIPRYSVDALAPIEGPLASLC